MTSPGATVAAFEAAFAEYVGARYAIAAANGTVTLQAALVALGVKPGDRVAVPPLTMSATTIAALNVGAVPVFCDVHSGTWVLNNGEALWGFSGAVLPVSLYGLHQPYKGAGVIDDAAQTLRPHGGASFTSYSFQASKILALGEGGMLVTDNPAFAEAARSYLSLGYRMGGAARIDSAQLKSPTFERHHVGMSINGRMNDLTAAEGQRQLGNADELLAERAYCAGLYRDAIAGCDWLTPQHVPEGWTHDAWTYAVAIEPTMPLGKLDQYRDRWNVLAGFIVKHGGECPYAAWRLTFSEPAFAHLDPGPDVCPVARDLQPRLMQFATNRLDSAERNAEALRRAIREVGG